jgi:hypothetical protein
MTWIGSLFFLHIMTHISLLFKLFLLLSLLGPRVISRKLPLLLPSLLLLKPNSLLSPASYLYNFSSCSSSICPSYSCILCFFLLSFLMMAYFTLLLSLNSIQCQTGVSDPQCGFHTPYGQYIHKKQLGRHQKKCEVRVG